MKAWLFQDPRQKQKLGDDAPWSVGWIDPEGKRKSKSLGAKSRAQKFARKIEGQLAAGTYESTSRKAWADFRKEFFDRGLPGRSSATRGAYTQALDHFQRLVSPARVDSISARTLDEFVAKRSAEFAKRSKNAAKDTPLVAAATVNKELRHVRAAIRKAAKWGYCSRTVCFEFLREPGKIPTYATPEHFESMYANANAAARPDGGHYTAADWWQALLVLAMMTGWRIGSLLSLRWDDVNLESGFALSRAADNKGKRDNRIPLHPLAVEHLRKIKGFGPLVFPWNYSRRTLYAEFAEIQKAAKVRREDGRAYGFHDFRRGFATMNASRLTAAALQSQMQHKSYTTTLKYINLAPQHEATVAALFVPKVGTAS